MAIYYIHIFVNEPNDDHHTVAARQACIGRAELFEPFPAYLSLAFILVVTLSVSIFQSFSDSFTHPVNVFHVFRSPFLSLCLYSPLVFVLRVASGCLALFIHSFGVHSCLSSE